MVSTKCIKMYQNVLKNKKNSMWNIIHIDYIVFKHY